MFVPAVPAGPSCSSGPRPAPPSRSPKEQPLAGPWGGDCTDSPPAEGGVSKIVPLPNNPQGGRPGTFQR